MGAVVRHHRELYKMSNETVEVRPLPASASFLFAAAGIEAVYVYAYHDDRWCLIGDGVEYWLFDEPEGLRLVENPF